MHEEIIRTGIQQDTAEPRKHTGADFDLSALSQRENYYETTQFLNKRKERFEEVGWQGGVDPKLDFSDVCEVITDIYRGKISPDSVPSNSKLAIIQAFELSGVEVRKDVIESLREKSEQEVASQRTNERTNKKQELKRQPKAPKPRWLKRAALAVPPLAIAAAYAGNGLLSSNSSVEVGDSQPRTSDVEVFEESQIEQESKSSAGVFSFLNKIEESIEKVVKRIPLVEELNEEDDDQDTRWGFNFALTEVKEGEEIDLSKFIHFEWESDKVTESNGGTLKAILYPVKDTGARTFGDECLYTPNKDCSKAIDNFIVIGGHSGVVKNNEGELVELATEPLRAFIEGHKLEYKLEDDGTLTPYFTDTLSREEREQKMDLLEEERPTITLGGHQVRAQVAVVRIEEVDRGKVYADWSQVVDIALEYDPNLGEQINLERGGLILAVSGRRLPGDKLSGKNHYDYTSSLILIFVGEKAVNSYSSIIERESLKRYNLHRTRSRSSAGQSASLT